MLTAPVDDKLPVNRNYMAPTCFSHNICISLRTSDSSVVNGITLAIENSYDIGQEKQRGMVKLREEKLPELRVSEGKKRFDLILVRTYAETWREKHSPWSLDQFPSDIMPVKWSL